MQIDVNAMLYLSFFTKGRGGYVASGPFLKKASLSVYLVYVKQTLLELYSYVTDPKISAGSGLYSNIMNARKHLGQ